MTPLEWGAIALTVAGVLYWLGRMPRTQVILAFIGTCIVTGGLFGHILSRTALYVEHFSDAVTARVFGAAIPGLIVIILLIIFIHDLHPKTGGAGKRTFWVGIALAACLIGGLSTFRTLNQVPSSVRTGVSNVSTIGG